MSPESTAVRTEARERKRTTRESRSWVLGALGAAGRRSSRCSWRSAFPGACAASHASGYVRTVRLPDRIEDIKLPSMTETVVFRCGTKDLTGVSGHLSKDKAKTKKKLSDFTKKVCCTRVIITK